MALQIHAHTRALQHRYMDAQTYSNAHTHARMHACMNPRTHKTASISQEQKQQDGTQDLPAAVALAPVHPPAPSPLTLPNAACAPRFPSCLDSLSEFRLQQGFQARCGVALHQPAFACVLSVCVIVPLTVHYWEKPALLRETLLFLLERTCSISSTQCVYVCTSSGKDYKMWAYLLTKEGIFVQYVSLLLTFSQIKDRVSKGKK